MFGPWKKIAEGYGKMVLGYFGKTPVEPDSEVMKVAQTQLNLPPTTESPLAINDRNPKKSIAAARKQLEDEGLPVTDENIFIAATCQDKGILFLKGGAKIGVRKISDEATPKIVAGPAKKPDAVTVTLANKAYGVKFAGNTVTINGVSYSFNVKDGIDESALAKTAILPKDAEAPGVSETHTVESPLPGLVLKRTKKPGDKVAVGETVLVIESMKMENPINSPYSGIIQEILIMQGDQIEAGQPLFRVGTVAHGGVNTVSRAAEAATKAPTKAASAFGAQTRIESPLPGLVLRIYKQPGEKVSAGESILVLESMKMETPINSAVSGVIESIAVKQGDQIESGQLLASVRE
jgi:pyruvate carboxylase subunit B